MDIDAAETFRLNHGDIVDAMPIQEWLQTHEVPRVDVVIGGPPCQGFSLLGKRDESDERNGLWHEYARTLLAAKPSYFVLENVQAFSKTRQIEEFCRATQGDGPLSDYSVEWAVLNAADYGVPQNRKRTIVIGRKRGLPALSMPAAVDAQERTTVRDAFKRSPAEPFHTDFPLVTYDRDGHTFKGPYSTRQLHVTRNYEPRTLERFGHIPKGGNRFDIPDELLSPCWRKHKTGSGDVMGRLEWEKPSVTIRTEFFKPEKGRYLHPVKHRAITPFEAARIQGFPDDYKWVGSKVSVSRQIGNAVPVKLAEAIAKHVASAAARAGIDRADPGCEERDRG